MKFAEKEMNGMEDGQIVQLYLDRDESTIKHSSEKYGTQLRALAYGIVQDMPTAEECENDTYLQAWNSIPPHEPRTYLGAYLCRLTRNISLNRCRERSSLKRGGHIVSLSAELEECIPAADRAQQYLEERELQRAINGFLGSLNREKRGIFLRRYWYLDSIEDIALRFGISQSKVKTTLYRLRGELRGYLEKEGHI